MPPVEAAINSVSRAIGSFHPDAMPVLTRGHYRRELVAWLFLPVMMGAVEGGVVSVLAKNAFADRVAPTVLDFAVALLAGAPAFANVTSFLWASLSHGRNKIRFLVALQITAAALVALIALAPANVIGLALLVVGAIGARMCWAGVATLRATVWRANYPRGVRANMAGKLATVQAIVLAAVSFAVGWSMRENDQAFHVLYPVAASAGLVGAVVYSRMRMRGHAALIADERRVETRDHNGLRGVWRVLGSDRRYRRYMIAMFVFGIGNIMVTAPLVIMLYETFGLGYLGGILITATIPILLMPVSIPLWSRLLDRVHIVQFRVIHAWAFVGATVAVLLAAVTRQPGWLWTFAVIKGIAFGGGVLGWNLGHHDFAPPALTSQYMGVHVTLTGIRGVIGPPAAVAVYTLLESRQAGGGGLVFALCLGLNLVGAAGFILLRRSMRADLEAPRG